MLTLGELIEILKAADPDAVVRYGFRNAHSWRSVYEEIAFEPAEMVRVGDMLAEAESAVGKTFQGYKGGLYTMSERTLAHFSEYGSSNEAPMARILFRLLLADVVP